ncbi:MAG: hypothetical protein JWR19_2470 [Pedosphaera sp.]|jgi:hypothetical protein|nr:hypothetical protein [Pedosphaera sp.]
MRAKAQINLNPILFLRRILTVRAAIVLLAFAIAIIPALAAEIRAAFRPLR